MPTIEIISVGASLKDAVRPVFQTFDYVVDEPPCTHRWLFADEFHSLGRLSPPCEFSRLQGFVVHLGNLGQVEGWFAGTLMVWLEDGGSPLRFKPAVRAELPSLISWLESCSPGRELVFSTDYQWGGKRSVHGPSLSIAAFFDHHDAGLLTYNTLYRLQH